jgi:hypothetical protein
MRLILTFLTVFLVIALAPAVSTGGKHIGDAAPIQVEVVYLHAPGVLTIDEGGATYYFPAWNWVYHAGRVYDESYYGVYPVYFIGQTMVYEIHIKNTSNRTYRNLKVVATQEYHLANGADYGEPLPGDGTQEWFIEKLAPHEEIVLTGEHYASYETLPGLNQTHVQIYHWFKGKAIPVEIQMGNANSPGRLFWDDPEAGLYCPPAFMIL